MAYHINSFDKISRKLGIQENGPMQAFLLDTAYRRMNKYVPRRDGNLRKNVMVTNQAIYYMSPYAEYQYRGRRKDGSRVVKKYTTPNTGPYWDEKMKSAEMDDLMKELKDEMRRGGGK